MFRLSAPLSVFLAVTNTCNLRCVYCSAGAGIPDESDLSPQELERVIGEIIDLRVFKVIITGGEPFIRRDIFDILQRFTTARVRVSVISNGTLITDEVAERLLAMDIKDISISLDDSTAEMNNQTRGDGAFERTISGVQTLIRQGIKPKILVTVTQANYKRVAEIAKGMKAYDVESVAFNLMAPIGRGRSCSTLTLTSDQVDEVSDLMKVVKGQERGFTNESFLYWYSYPKRLEMHRETLRSAVPTMLPCDAAKASCAIAADGTVYPCNRFEGYSCGNLRVQSLSDIWRGEAMERVRALGGLATMDSTGCSICKYNQICMGGCRADAYSRFRDLEAPDPHCLVLPDSAAHEYEGCSELVRISDSGVNGL